MLSFLVHYENIFRSFLKDCHLKAWFCTSQFILKSGNLWTCVLLTAILRLLRDCLNVIARFIHIWAHIIERKKFMERRINKTFYSGNSPLHLLFGVNTLNRSKRCKFLNLRCKSYWCSYWKYDFVGDTTQWE